MAGQLTIDTLKASTGVLATQNGMTGICKAWVNFNGTAATIRASFNVSSITRNGTGDYTVAFTTAMPNTNYAVVNGQGIPSNAASNAVDYPTGGKLTTSYNTVFYQTAVPTDNTLMMQAVFSS